MIKRVKSMRSDVESLVYGDLLQELAWLKYGVKDRNKIRGVICPEDIKECDKLFFEKIQQQCKNPYLLIEAHGFTKTDYGYKFEPFKDLEKMGLGGVVMLQAEPSKIIGYRENDKSKKRIEEKVKEIETHQNLIRAEVMIYSSLLEIPGYFLNNNNKKLETVVEKFLSIMEEIKG